MTSTNLPHTDLPYNAVLRAEDAPSQPTRWTMLCEGVLIPLSSILGIFLFMVAIMLITD